MKATDLMIGDWVYVVVEWKPEVKYMHGEVSELLAEDGWLRVLQTYDPYEDNPIYCICDTQGIPLTPEILEKNGWSYDDLVQEYYGEMRIMGSQAPYSIRDGIEITYVHELQHALKLCGIDKQITL